jgi:hypothetical protein
VDGKRGGEFVGQQGADVITRDTLVAERSGKRGSEGGFAAGGRAGD